jgi:quinol monooxygenase YgiN
MYCVIYEFTVDQHNENQFKKLWHELTLCIKAESKSLGSRLHKSIESENTWIAYAQWPSKQTYDNTPEEVTYEAIRQQFLATISGIKIVYEMECVDDLFG